MKTGHPGERFRMACIAGLFMTAGPVVAASISTTFEVRLAIENACTISATDHDFGSHEGTPRWPLTAQSALRIRCTRGTPYQVSLSASSGVGGRHATRRMTHVTGQDTVEYSLYRDSARTLAWDENDGLSGVATGLPQTLPVFGSAQEVPSDLRDGVYFDTVIATVNF